MNVGKNMSFKKASDCKLDTDKNAPTKTIDDIRVELKRKIDVAIEGYFYQTTIQIPKSIDDNVRASLFSELHEAGYTTYIDESGPEVFLEVKWDKPTK